MSGVYVVMTAAANDIKRLLLLPSCLVLVWLQIGEAEPSSAELKRFAAAKRAQTRELAATLTNQVPPQVWSFFDAVMVDDWETATNLAARLASTSGRNIPDRNLVSPALRTALWQPLHETIGANEQFHLWEDKWRRRYADGIIAAVARGSVFFGGTDPGRFLITAMSESHREGLPFFTLTQNQLVDGLYLDYLRGMYGKKLKLPSETDAHTAFQDYLTDAQLRLQTGKLKPGEDVRIVGDRVQVSGQVAFMQINARLVKMVFDQNPERRFFIEESYPLDWMYPHLVPRGLIFEIERTPTKALSAPILAADQDCWHKLVGEMIGNWITEETTVREICEFGEEIYLRKNLAVFNGDVGFAKNEYAQKSFSKLRSAIAGVFVWRMEQTKDELEQEQMREAAELAYKQAYALCPSSPEVLFRYAQLLVNRKRSEEALLLARTSLRFSPDETSFKELVRALHEYE